MGKAKRAKKLATKLEKMSSSSSVAIGDRIVNLRPDFGMFHRRTLADKGNLISLSFDSRFLRVFPLTETREGVQCLNCALVVDGKLLTFYYPLDLNKKNGGIPSPIILERADWDIYKTPVTKEWVIPYYFVQHETHDDCRLFFTVGA